MPRIKAYKGAGKIIPLDEAKVATAFRCPWTKRVFGAKKDYVAHLKQLRRDRIHAAIRRNIFQRQHEDLWSQPSFEDMIAWVERNPDFFFDKAVGSRGEGRQDRIAAYRDKFWIRITYLSIQWTDSASNSHARPRGGFSNWGGRDKHPQTGEVLPRGYPGWTGQIEYQMSHDLGFGSDVMRGTGINTGTGGGRGDNCYGYGVTFFDSDWPAIAARKTEMKVEAVLAERNTGWDRVKYGEPRYFR